MVSFRVLILILAEAPARPLIQQLDPARNVAVIMALLGLVLVGVTLVACIMIGGHWVRRLALSRPRQKPSPNNNNESWRAALAEKLPDGKTSETILSDAPTDDTRTD